MGGRGKRHREYNAHSLPNPHTSVSQSKNTDCHTNNRRNKMSMSVHTGYYTSTCNTGESSDSGGGTTPRVEVE